MAKRSLWIMVFCWLGVTKSGFGADHVQIRLVGYERGSEVGTWEISYNGRVKTYAVDHDDTAQLETRDIPHNHFSYFSAAIDVAKWDIIWSSWAFGGIALLAYPDTRHYGVWATALSHGFDWTGLPVVISMPMQDAHARWNDVVEMGKAADVLDRLLQGKWVTLDSYSPLLPAIIHSWDRDWLYQ